jgi:hypothetical protein
MNLTSRVALGSLGGLMLLHAGCSAFEALTYEKAVDPIAALEICHESEPFRFAPILISRSPP